MEERGPMTTSIPKGMLLTALVFSIVFLLLGYIRSESGLIHAFDTGLYLQILSNLWAGRGWASSITGEELFLAHHFQPVLALLMPIHKIWGSAFGMLFVSWGFIAASSLFLATYLPRRGIASERSARVIALAFFLHPTVTSRMYYSFVPEVMALPALCFLAALLERKEKLQRKDWIFLLLSLIFASLCKETIWLTSAGVSVILAVAYRKDQEAKYFALLASVFVGIFCYLFLKWMPEHSSLSSYYGLSYYKNEWIDGRWGFAGKILGAILNVFTMDSLLTLVTAVVLIPLGLVLFGGYWALLGAVPAVFLMIASNQSQVQDLTNHYLLAALPFLAVSSAVGLDHVLARFQDAKVKRYAVGLVVLVPLSVTLLHNSGFIFQSLFATARTSPGLREAANQLQSEIDSDDLVLVDGALQPLFPDLPHSMVILGFQGNPTHVTAEHLQKVKHVITTNDLAEIKDCRSLKPGEGDLSIFDYEGFYQYCEWLKKTPFEKKEILPNRLIDLKRVALP
jgi:uncharacterized membrane protein